MEKVYIFYLFHLSDSKIVSIHKNKKCAYKAMINHINELFLYERKEWLEFRKGHYQENSENLKSNIQIIIKDLKNLEV